MSDHFKIAWHRLSSLCAEFRLGIETRGSEAAPNGNGLHYTPLPYPLIWRMLKTLKMGENDVFVDVGCGKGRVTCCACRQPIKKVVAIELNASLLRRATSNADRVRARKSEIEYVWMSAEEYDYAGATVVYLYNPFNADLMGRVMAKVLQSYECAPRTIRIVYANPVHEEILTRAGWLQRLEDWPASDFPVFGYRLSIWGSVEAGGEVLNRGGVVEPARTGGPREGSAAG